MAERNLNDMWHLLRNCNDTRGLSPSLVGRTLSSSYLAGRDGGHGDAKRGNRGHGGHGDGLADGYGNGHCDRRGGDGHGDRHDDALCGGSQT